MTAATKVPDNTIKMPVKRRIASFADPLEYKIISDGEIPFTQQKAFEYLEYATFEGERSVRERHVQFLYDEWNAGRFMWHHVILGSAELGGTRYRLNGQHTCWFRVNIHPSKEPVPPPKVREIVYKVETSDQLRALYSTFDRNASRTPAHIGRVLLMDTNSCRDIPHGYISKLVSGFRVFFSEDWDRERVAITELTGIIEKNYSELFNIVGRFSVLHWEESIPCHRQAVIGAMFATFEKNVMRSAEFWEPVWSGIGLNEKTDARYKLKQYLETHAHISRERGGVSIIGAEDLYRVCIGAWNRWRQNEPVDRLIPTERRFKAKA